MTVLAESPQVLAPEQEPLVSQSPEHPSALRRTLGAVGVAGVIALGGVAGATYGAFTPTDIELGPHQATAQVTLNNRIDFDFGLLGSASRQSGWIGGAGVKIVVKGIRVPADQSALASASTVVDQYEQLLTNPKHIEANAERTVEHRIKNDAIEGSALLGAAGITLFSLADLRRRRKDAALSGALETIESAGISDTEKAKLRKAVLPSQEPRNYRRAIALSTGVLLIGAACSGDYAQAHNAPDPAAIDHVLDGTPFQGFTINGELLRLVVDEAGPKIKQYIETDQAFYDKTAANFRAAFAEKFSQTPPGHAGLIYLLSVSDNHCNIGMDQVHANIAHAFEADAVIDTGDTTMGGTAAEAECVSAFADSIEHYKIPIIAIRGNHDSSTTEDQERKDGETVIGNNETIKGPGGLTIMAVGDARETRFGGGTKLYDPNYTIEDEGNDLAKAAAKVHPDILLVHDPDAAIPSVTSGFTLLSLSGDTHHLSGPNLLNPTTGSYQFTEGTSGGAKPNALTVGPLQQAAIETVFVLDEQTHRPVGYYIVTSNPDTSVHISDFTPMPTAAGITAGPNKSGD
jgi:hypothetical protein